MKKEMLIPKWYKTSSYHFHLKGNFAMHTHIPSPSIIVVGYSTEISFLRLLLEYHNDSLMLYFYNKIVALSDKKHYDASKIIRILQIAKFLS